MKVENLIVDNMRNKEKTGRLLNCTTCHNDVNIIYYKRMYNKPIALIVGATHWALSEVASGFLI